MCRMARGRTPPWIPGFLFVQLHFLCAAIDAIEGHKDVGVGATTNHITCPHRHFVEHLPREGCGSRALASRTNPADLPHSHQGDMTRSPSSVALKRALAPSNQLRMTGESGLVTLCPPLCPVMLEESSFSEREHMFHRNTTESPSVN